MNILKLAFVYLFFLALPVFSNAQGLSVQTGLALEGISEKRLKIKDDLVYEPVVGFNIGLEYTKPINDHSSLHGALRYRRLGGESRIESRKLNFDALGLQVSGSRKLGDKFGIRFGVSGYYILAAKYGIFDLLTLGGFKVDRMQYGLDGAFLCYLTEKIALGIQLSQHVSSLFVDGILGVDKEYYSTAVGLNAYYKIK